MKGLVSIITLALAVAFTAPAFAASAGGQPLTKSECKKSGLMWNDQSNVCAIRGKR